MLALAILLLFYQANTSLIKSATFGTDGIYSDLQKASGTDLYGAFKFISSSSVIQLKPSIYFFTTYTAYMWVYLDNTQTATGNDLFSHSNSSSCFKLRSGEFDIGALVGKLGVTFQFNKWVVIGFKATSAGCTSVETFVYDLTSLDLVSQATTVASSSSINTASSTITDIEIRSPYINSFIAQLDVYNTADNAATMKANIDFKTCGNSYLCFGKSLYNAAYQCTYPTYCEVTPSDANLANTHLKYCIAKSSCFTCNALPAASAACTKCGEGYVLSSGSCVQTCAAGYYIEYTSCFPCPPGFECSTAIKINKCKEGYYSTGKAIACTICPANSRCPNANDVPIACAYGEYSVDGSTSCTACPAGYYCVTKNSVVPITVCSIGNYCPGGKYPMQQCPAGYLCASAALVTATVCPDGYYQDTVGQDKCKLCTEGYYCPAPFTLKIQCPVGYYSNNGAKTCTKCPVDYSCAAGATNPTRCDRGYFALPGSGSCTICPKGFYCDDNYDANSVEAKPCSLGYYSIDGSTSCTKCSPGFKCTDPSSTPSECGTGFYAPAGSIVCLQCPAGKYCTKYGELFYAKASDCPLGTFSLKGLEECTSCPEGYYCPTQTHNKILCHAYSYNYALGLTSLCPLTPMGYKVPSAVGAVPTLCNPGQYDLYPFGECLDCPKGFQCGDPAASPVECDYGYYAPGGNAMCFVCPAGYKCPDKTRKIPCTPGYYSAYGEVECHACPLGWECKDNAYYGMYKCEHGYYVSGNVCTRCPAGQYCLYPEMSPVDCPSGYYSIGGAPRCSICPAGFQCATKNVVPTKCSDGYWSDPGTIACSACPNNYECYSGRKFRCPRSHFSTGTADKCKPCTDGMVCSETTLLSFAIIDCNDGFYASQIDNVCKICPPGHMCPTGARTPTKCSINEFQLLYGQTTCNTCASNSYSPEGQAYCRFCPDGYFCGSGAPVKCPAGQYGENNECIDGIQGFTYPAGTMYKHPRDTLCPKGFYCPSNPAKNRTDIMPCPGGTYGIIGGAYDLSQCKACPRGYYCPPGTDNYLMFECPASTYCPLGAQRPTKCPEGTFSEDRGCWDLSQCRPNPPGFQTSSGSGSPEICPKGYYCPGDKKFKCPPGTYSGGRTGLKDISECELCPAGRYCPEGSAEALEYVEGYYNPWMGLHTSNYFLKCPSSYSCDSKSLTSYRLKRCVKGKYCPVASTAPVDCPEGYWSDSYTLSLAEECTKCKPGYVCAAGSTSAVFIVANLCPIGYYCPSGSSLTNKKQCPAGTYSLVGTKFIEDCIPCIAGKFCLIGSTQVDMTANDCPRAYYCPEGTSYSTQYPCPKGTYTSNSASTGRQTIERCKDEVCGLGNKCTDLAGQTQTPCAAGTYNNFNYYSTTCSTCPAGYKCANAANIDPVVCPVGTYSSDGASSCPTCDIGYYCPYEGMTQTDMLTNYICPKGYLCVNGTFGINVSPDLDNYGCSAGHYCPAGTHSESDCPAGTYLPYKGRGNITDCIDTPAGYYTADGATSFINNKCDEGYYCLIKSTTSNPWPCPMGTFRNVKGGADATDCGLCPARYYCPNVATIAPLECPQGSYCPSGTIEPVLCPKGTYGNATKLWDSRSCTLCDAGYFCDKKGMTGITALNMCDAGYYCKSGAKKPEPEDGGISGSTCPKGGYCPKGAISPSKCPAGQLMLIEGTSDNTKCTPCPRGYYCEQTDQPIPTGKCKAGYYCGYGETVSAPAGQTAAIGEYAPEGSAFPTKCPRGYKQGFAAQEECVVCSAGNLCDYTGLTDSIPCPQGFYCPAVTTYTDVTLYGKIPCPPGTYGSIPGLKDSSQCTPCDAGKYCPYPGQSSNNGSCDARYFCKSGSKYRNPPILTANYGPCTMGYYCIAGTSDPVPCPIGTYSTITMLDSSADCVPCPSGFYCNELGLTSYAGKECAEGYYCTEGSTSPYQNYCTAGHYCPRGSGTELLCPPGLYQPDIAQAKCLECAPGSYCINGEQKSCKSGYFCP